MAAQKPPKNLLIYYGYPSLINSCHGDVDHASSHFGEYDYVVLGAGLQLEDHCDHSNVVAILSHSCLKNTIVFGYVNLGNTNNYAMEELKTCIDAWKKINGISGIFFDEFGYDYGVTRERQNLAVTYAHSEGLVVVANAFRPEDAFDDAVRDVFNPAGTPTCLGEGDFYLYESYQIMHGEYVSDSQWRSKSSSLEEYRKKLGFDVLSITTTNEEENYGKDRFFYSWFSAFIDGHVATGWGEKDFSAIRSVAPFYLRPDDMGTAVHAKEHTGNSRYERMTTKGVIFVDAGDSKKYGFTAKNEGNE